MGRQPSSCPLTVTTQGGSNGGGDCRVDVGGLRENRVSRAQIKFIHSWGGSKTKVSPFTQAWGHTDTYSFPLEVPARAQGYEYVKYRYLGTHLIKCQTAIPK